MTALVKSRSAITIVYSGGANFEASTLAAPKLSKKGLLGLLLNLRRAKWTCVIPGGRG
jgi:hypothetical protein